MGAALCGGQAFVMLKNFFEQTLRAFLPALSDEQLQAGGLDLYRVMTSVPYKEDVCDLPIVETLFDGTRFAPWKRGYIENISLSNFTPENLILGFLKGISRELHDFYKGYRRISVMGKMLSLVREMPLREIRSCVRHLKNYSDASYLFLCIRRRPLLALV